MKFILIYTVYRSVLVPRDLETIYETREGWGIRLAKVYTLRNYYLCKNIYHVHKSDCIGP